MTAQPELSERCASLFVFGVRDLEPLNESLYLSSLLTFSGTLAGDLPALDVTTGQGILLVIDNDIDGRHTNATTVMKTAEEEGVPALGFSGPKVLALIIRTEDEAPIADDAYHLLYCLPVPAGTERDCARELTGSIRLALEDNPQVAGPSVMAVLELRGALVFVESWPHAGYYAHFGQQVLGGVLKDLQDKLGIDPTSATTCLLADCTVESSGGQMYVA